MSGISTNAFLVVHGSLLGIIAAARGAVDAAARAAVVDRMAVLRCELDAESCAKCLLSYERYLAVLSLMLEDPGLKDRLTLLNDDRFEVALRRDPSDPDILMVAALSRIQRNDVRRGRHLLLRLAASQFRERVVAQEILGSLMRGGSQS